MLKKRPINPWLRIWTHPRETIQSIIHYSTNYCLPLLYWIYGFPLLLQILQNAVLPLQTSLAPILLTAALGGIVFGWMGINLTSILLYWTGKWIQGKANYPAIRSAVSWSGSISLVTIGLWILQMAFFGSHLFDPNFLQTPFTPNEMTLLGVSSLIQSGVGIWGMFIILNTVAEVQQFSIWKALLNLFLMACVLAGGYIAFSLLMPCFLAH